MNVGVGLWDSILGWLLLLLLLLFFYSFIFFLFIYFFFPVKMSVKLCTSSFSLPFLYPFFRLLLLTFPTNGDCLLSRWHRSLFFLMPTLNDDVLDHTVPVVSLLVCLVRLSVVTAEQ